MHVFTVVNQILPEWRKLADSPLAWCAQSRMQLHVLCALLTCSSSSSWRLRGNSQAASECVALLLCMLCCLLGKYKVFIILCFSSEWNYVSSHVGWCGPVRPPLIASLQPGRDEGRRMRRSQNTQQPSKQNNQLTNWRWPNRTTVTDRADCLLLPVLPQPSPLLSLSLPSNPIGVDQTQSAPPYGQIQALRPSPFLSPLVSTVCKIGRASFSFFCCCFSLRWPSGNLVKYQVKNTNTALIHKCIIKNTQKPCLICSQSVNGVGVGGFGLLCSVCQPAPNWTCEFSVVVKSGPPCSLQNVKAAPSFLPTSFHPLPSMFSPQVSSLTHKAFWDSWTIQGIALLSTRDHATRKGENKSSPCWRLRHPLLFPPRCTPTSCL